jgi:hypothetical protein
MIPIDVDTLLAQTRGQSSFSGVTRVTRVTPSAIPNNHAGEELLTTVTQAVSQQGDMGDRPQADTPDAEAVTRVTLLSLALGDSRIESQGIVTEHVRKSVTHVTHVTQEKELGAPITLSTPDTPQKEHRDVVSQREVADACPQREHISPPPYPGRPVGAPFRPGRQVWLYRWDDQTPRFDAPVTTVQMRTLWPGEQDIGWCNDTGEVTWHNARLAVPVERSKAC